MLARTTVLLAALGTFVVPPPPPRPAVPVVPVVPVVPGLLSGLVWRNLGPFRGGRISAVSGAIGQPGVFYVGLPLGGVWKTTSAGETWTPILDGLTTVSSVGAVVASFLRAASGRGSKPSDAKFRARSSMDSSNDRNTPGSSNWRAPLIKNSIERIVLPHPGPPQMSVGRPRGNPPPVISSSP
jgi:hypothetical protein